VSVGDETKTEVKVTWSYLQMSDSRLMKLVMPEMTDCDRSKQEYHRRLAEDRVMWKNIVGDAITGLIEQHMKCKWYFMTDHISPNFSTRYKHT